MSSLKRVFDPRDRRGGYALPHVALVAAVVALVKLLLLAVAVYTGVAVYHHFHPHGGMVPPPQPAKTVRIEGGMPPAAYDLRRFEIRQHNQQSTNSCVWQTVSQIMEVWNREYGRTSVVSGGYGWNRSVGYANVGMTYEQAARIATDEGAPRLSTWGNDGTFAEYAPALSSDVRHRASGWSYLSPGDRLSMERVIASGTPLAIALPWYSSLTYKSDCSIVYSQRGYFSFWHSTIGDAYNQYGVHIRNSWPGWGCGNGAWLSWGFLASTQPDGSYAIVMSLQPAAPIHRPGFHHRIWNAWRVGHRKSLIPYRRHGKLRDAARLWQPRAERARGVVRIRVYHPRHGVTYTRATFANATLFFWDRRGYAPKWVWHPHIGGFAPPAPTTIPQPTPTPAMTEVPIQ